MDEQVAKESKNLQELRELVAFLKENDIAEFEMEREDLQVRLKFAGAAAPAADFAQMARMMSSGQAAPLAQAAAATSAAPAAPVAAAADPDAGLQMVKSPIVGTFYDAPAPGAAPFAKVGDVVTVGQVLCIVEAMKLMNEIESDVAGEIVRIVPKPGQPVEYGQPLFAVKPR